MNRIFKKVIFIAFAFSILGCSIYSVKGPGLGITSEFYHTNSREFVSENSYDFNKLKNGYGLLIFSYEFIGKKKDEYNVINPDKFKGIRVYEHYFKENDSTLFIKKDSPDFLHKTGIGLPSQSYTMGEMLLTFKKGQIIYGGRIFIDSDNDIPEMRNRFQEDCAPFLSQYSKELHDIKIDTTLIFFEWQQNIIEDSIIFKQ